MKTVGKQLEEGRLDKKWTPEMAARETKIRVDRLLDLESDNFSNFSNPTYARGFVRTYARALNLDEYRLLRQLDQKLPEWDGTLLSESGVVYMTHSPELPPQQPRGNKLGSALLWALCLVSCGLIAVVLYANYTALPEKSTTTADSHTEPDPTSANPTAAPQALPVNPADLPHALPVAANPGDGSIPVAPVAGVGSPAATPLVAVASPAGAPLDVSAIPVAPAVSTDPAPSPTNSTGPARAVPVDPNELAKEIAAANSSNPTALVATTPVPALSPAVASRALSLFSHGDCYVTIKQVDSHNKAQLIYQNEIHAGDTVDFDGLKFRVKLSDPAMIDVNVNGALYSHHTDHDEETFDISARP